MAEGLLISAFIEEGYRLEEKKGRKLYTPDKLMADVYDDDMK